MPEPLGTRPGRFCGYALRVGDADYRSTPSVADFPASRDREDRFLEPGCSGPMELVFAPTGLYPWSLQICLPAGDSRGSALASRGDVLRARSEKKV